MAFSAAIGLRIGADRTEQVEALAREVIPAVRAAD
jgi:hypothetical protein